MALLTGTVTGRFEDSTVGATEPYSGTITFTPEADYLLSDTSVVLPSPVKVDVLNSYFSVELVATNDPQLNPVNFTYRVDMNLKANGYPVKRQPFSISVPSGQVTDLAKVAPVSSSSGVPMLRGEQGPAGPPGTSATPVPDTLHSFSNVGSNVTVKAVKDINKVVVGSGSIAALGTNIVGPAEVAKFPAAVAPNIVYTVTGSAVNLTTKAVTQVEFILYPANFDYINDLEVHLASGYTMTANTSYRVNFSYLGT